MTHPPSTNDPSPSKEPIRCLVIQLARLGDTLQSLMALRAAKQLYPQLEIHFLARERFSSAAQRIPWIHKVITLPTDALLGPVLSGTKTDVEALGEVARWIAPLVKDPWYFVINWSFSEASSYLTGLIPARVKLGYTRRRDSSFAGADGWSHYVQAIVQGNISQNIHLTDILTTQLLTALQIHLGEALPEGNSPVTSKAFFSLTLKEQQIIPPLISSTKKWISIQLGAGKKSKTWNPKHWAKLAHYLIQRHPEYGIILLGGKEDLEREKIFKNELNSISANSDSIISLVAQTDFDIWASVVSKSDWLFSGDTAALHLASVLGTRVLNISAGPVKHSETGPYGNGHYVIHAELECQGCAHLSSQNAAEHAHSCGDDISPESVYGVWLYGFQEWIHRRQISIENHFAYLGWTQHLEKVRIYRSKIRNAHDGGGVTYEFMTSKYLRMSDWSGMVMGHVARAWYCGWVPTIGQEITRKTMSPQLIQKIRELEESGEVFSKICEQAYQTATTLNRKSASLRSDKVMGVQDREELRALGKTLLELENLIDRLAKTHAPLLAFSQMAKVMMQNLKGTHLADLGKETADYYRQINEGVTIYREWIKYTLNLAKPVALSPPNVTLLPPPSRPRDPDIFL